MACKCGCGESVKSGRVFVNKEHQLEWMASGGGIEMNRLQPIEAKRRGGITAGSEAHDSGRLAEAAKKGGERSRVIAREFRERRTARGDGS